MTDRTSETGRRPNPLPTYVMSEVGTPDWIASRPAVNAQHRSRPWRRDLDPIIEVFGTWAITEYGLEALHHHYSIRWNILDDRDWVEHLALKTWVRMIDFVPCERRAKEYRREDRRPRKAVSDRTRFAVLKRDGYRCQLCGASAADGARLEVDHRVSRAKGGSNNEANLHALCFACNRGKSDQEL